MEKLTGLSQRSIRLYEEKGLLDVKRDDENQYRTYTEEGFERLKLIRVLRYFDFTIDEIRELLLESDNTVLIEALSKKADSYADKVDDYESKSEQCRSLVKDFKKSDKDDTLDDYIEMIGALDDEDVREIKELSKQIEHPSLGATIIWTIILSGPILTGLLRGVNSRMHIILIVVSSILLTVEWFFYIRSRSRRPEYQKSRNKGSLWILPVTIACIMLNLFVFAGLSVIQEKWIAHVLGNKWLFYEEYWLTTMLLIVVASIVVVCFGLMLLYKATGNEEYEQASNTLRFLWKHRIVTVVVLIVIIYVATIGATAVTDNEIIKFSAVYPKGKGLSFDEIDSVETGFSRRGDFYYKLKYGNRTIKFGTTIPNTAKYPEDGDYKELVDFDAKLMSLNIPKTADGDSIQYADYSEDCMKNFEIIINNTGVTNDKSQ